MRLIRARDLDLIKTMMIKAISEIPTGYSNDNDRFKITARESLDKYSEIFVHCFRELAKTNYDSEIAQFEADEIEAKEL